MSEPDRDPRSQPAWDHPIGPVTRDGEPPKPLVKPGPDEAVGTGAVLGVRLLRNSGIQATAVGVSAVLQLVTLLVISYFLGASELGRYAIIFFTAGLIGQLLTIAAKPGTLRRTFGEADDEDDDDSSDDEVSTSPRESLGTGMALALLLALAGAGVAILLREPLAELALGSAEDSELIVWAAALAAATVVFRLVAIVIWFERRPVAFMVCELSRPVIGLLAVTIMLAAGAGIEAAIAGAAAGALVAAIIGLVLLRDSITLSFDLPEVGRIMAVGWKRAPIMMSFWSIGNLDVLILAAFVTDAELGVYTLASRFGFMGSFIPQGFRLGLRPLRKAAIFRAVEEQYGRTEQRGQILGYFVLSCITAVTAMVLISRAVVDLAPSDFASFGPLVPLAAAGMMGPPLLRTINQQTTWPGRTRRTLAVCAVGGALLFIGITIALAPEIDAYAAPVGMILGILTPGIYLFVRSQRGPDRIAFPYNEVVRALAISVAVSCLYAVLPDLGLIGDLAIGFALGALFLLLCAALGVVPARHRSALLDVARSLVSGRPDPFRPRRGLRGIEPDERNRLRAAVDASWAGQGGAGQAERLEAHGEELVRILRRVGDRGGMPVGDPTERDAMIARLVLTDEPTAVRNATLRRLLDEGADAGDLRALEDLVSHLARVPDGAWAGESLKNGSGEGAGALSRPSA